MNTRNKALQESPFTIQDCYDIEILGSLSSKLGCSLTTVYRSIRKARLPIYCLPPNKRSQVIVLTCDLWRLAHLACWRKFLKRQGYKKLGMWKLWHLRKDFANSDLLSLYKENWFKPLTLQEIMSAVDFGLIPADDQLSLPAWFIASVKGLLDLGLPRKI